MILPKLRNKISISAGNTNRALRDIISPTSIGSYVESVEALNYGFHNTKIAIMVDNWINGVPVNGLAERFTRRVIVYNRVNLSTIIPVGAVVPTTSVAAAVAVLNSKYCLDLTEDDIEIKNGKIVAKATSLGYYEEQDVVTEVTCAADRVNFFFSLTMARDSGNMPKWVEGFVEQINVYIDDELHEVFVSNSNNPGYNNRMRRTVLALQQFFAGRSDIEMMVNFDTYANVQYGSINGPASDTLLVPNITLVNKVGRDVSVEIYYAEHESLLTGLLPLTTLKPMGTMLPVCPLSHRGFITIPDTDNLEGFEAEIRIKTIKINDAVYANIEDELFATWKSGSLIFADVEDSYTTLLSRVFDVTGINNLLRIYANSSFKTRDYDNKQVPTFMIENISSEVVVIEFELNNGTKHKLELAGDPRKDEPWFRRCLVPIFKDSMYIISNGSYGGSGGVSTKVNGVEIDNDFSVPWLGELFKYIIYGDFLAANKIEVNLWEDITGKDNPIPILTIENLDTVAKTFEASFPMDENNQSDGFRYLIPYTNLGPHGVAGADLLYGITGDNIYSRLIRDDNFLDFNRYHFSLDGIDIPEAEKQVDDPSNIIQPFLKLGPGFLATIFNGGLISGQSERLFTCFSSEFPQLQRIYVRAKGGDSGYTSPLNVLTPLDLNPVPYPALWIMGGEGAVIQN